MHSRTAAGGRPTAEPAVPQRPLDALGASSRIEFFPLRIAALGDNNYSVMRVGGRKKLATREAGIETIRLLRTGATVAETSAILATQRGCSKGVSIDPLIRSMAVAGMVRSIDGRRLDVVNPSIRDRMKFHLRFTLLPHYDLMTGRLPLQWGLPLLEMAHRQELRTPFAGKIRDAGRNFAGFFPGAGEADRRSFEGSYFRHLVRNIVEVEALRQREHAEMDAWLGTHLQMSGLANLERAVRRGRGVVLMGYHFSANRLLPVALMRHGYSLLSMGAINMGWDAGKTRAYLQNWQQTRPSYGQVDLVDNLDIASVNKLIRHIRNGGIVLTAPDVYTLSTFEDDTVAERSHFFGIVRSSFPRARHPVPFLGRTIEINPWCGWLASFSRPVVAPIRMIRKGGMLCCEVGEPFDIPDELELSQRSYIAALNEQIFGRLGDLLCSEPEQWFGWHNLHKLLPQVCS